MGIFGWIGEKVSAAKDWVCEKVKSAAKAVKKGVTNMWNKFSGKDKFEEAEKLYEEITARYNNRRKLFEEDLDIYVKKIEEHVKSINDSKEKIKKELFPSMAKKMEKIKDISVSQDFTVEEFINQNIKIDSVRSKSELYKIDFNKNKFKTTVQSIFTLGFYTRKKAKETLYAVQEEEKKIDSEIKKMDAEIAKLQAIEKSLDNVERYFVSLIENYENMLIRLDNSVNFLYVRCLSFAHKIIAEEMSIRRLSNLQRKEVEAIITASKILKTMTDTQVVSLEDKNKINSYSRDMEQQYKEINKIYEAA